MGNLQEIDLKLLAECDFDNYTDWVFHYQAMTREEKKDRVRSLLRIGKFGSDEENKRLIPYTEKRWAIDTVFFKHKYWKAPSENDIDDFWWARKSMYDSKMGFFYHSIKGNALPFKLFIDKFYEDVYDSISFLKLESVIDCVLNRWLTEEYCKLGSLAGLIDFLKELSQKSELSPSDIAHGNKTTEELVRDQSEVTWLHWKKNGKSKAPVFYLTAREKKIMTALNQYTIEDAAVELGKGYSVRTIKTYIAHLQKRFNVQGLNELKKIVNRKNLNPGE